MKPSPLPLLFLLACSPGRTASRGDSVCPPGSRLLPAVSARRSLFPESLIWTALSPTPTVPSLLFSAAFLPASSFPCSPLFGNAEHADDSILGLITPLPLPVCSMLLAGYFSFTETLHYIQGDANWPAQDRYLGDPRPLGHPLCASAGEWKRKGHLGTAGSPRSLVLTFPNPGPLVIITQPGTLKNPGIQCVSLQLGAVPLCLPAASDWREPGAVSWPALGGRIRTVFQPTVTRGKTRHHKHSFPAQCPSVKF